MNKNIFIIFITLNLFLAQGVFAMATSGSKGADSEIQSKQQIQVMSQGQTNQNQGNDQFQGREIVDDGSVKTQNQNQVRNEDEDNKGLVRERENSNENENKASNGEQMRSRVANAVQQMIQVADRNGGIGEQIRVIAQGQNQDQDKIKESLDKIESRNSLVKIFIGPNYGEINNAQKILERNRIKIEQLNQVQSQLQNQEDAQILDEQIKVIEQANEQIENSLESANKGFSVLGWMFKLFTK